MPIMINGKAYANRGFTLVEMSIVLVIIGLIIGGILKGQEIIQSARTKAVVSQVNAVKAATSTYFDRYRALPGDDPTANTAVDPNVASGDGNGIVGATAGATGTLASNAGNAGENFQFFNGLIAAGLLNGGSVSSGTTATAFGNSALPASPISGTGMTVVYGTHTGDTSATTARTAHWVRMHKNAAAPLPMVSARTMRVIDNSIDDGLPLTGGVRTNVTAPCNSGTAAVGLAYNASDDIGCIGIFEVTQ